MAATRADDRSSGVRLSPFRVGERLEAHFAPRGQTNSGASGRRLAVLKEAGPPLQCVLSGCPRTTVPSLALADLGGGSEVVDSSALGWLVDRSL